MAPTASCTFFNSITKTTYENEEIYGALLMVTTSRDKRKTQCVSKSNEQQIMTRLRKNTLLYESFKNSCPSIGLQNFSIMEQKFQVRINIWHQSTANDVPQLVLISTGDSNYDAVNLVSKTFTPTNPSLT